ncbi:unnamed protein product, partial [Nesidiocoris tenuis]
MGRYICKAESVIPKISAQSTNRTAVLLIIDRSAYSLIENLSSPKRALQGALAPV